MQIEQKLMGTFSDSEVRSGLAEIADRDQRNPADKRLSALEKYRYEILYPVN